MLKNEFIKAIKVKAADRDYKFTNAEVDVMLSCISEAIVDVIAEEDSVRFGDLCTFSGTSRAARTARNPATGAIVQLPERHGVAKCKFRKSVKDMCKQ